MIEHKKPVIFWTWVTCNKRNMIIAGTEKGLCFVGPPTMLYDDLIVWVNKWYPGCQLIRDDNRCDPFAIQLTEYIKGERTIFTFPVDMRGTPFQLKVWRALHHIPYGETRSYSDIADQIGKPLSARAVGAAIGANPILIMVPCHRVIAKNGSLTGYRGGLDMKMKLLELERNMLRAVPLNREKALGL
ncbi:methylated-DNA--[protein]-cysteine S-methyltransferase [Siminovitchia sp. 179-K 8D1 HS]|uniref:methylated-DNA--[protein]-cysteine S-methyltransferase n=1 Tax=Siminovitchia sp. 179-K 8D1 HS TaxID=3142385 RepID=UPI0039A344EC